MAEKKNFRILIEGVINKMIPSNKSFVVTKTSKIINTNKFVKIVKKDHNLKEKIRYFSDMIEKSKIKNYDYFINKIFRLKVIEKKIETQLLQDYFTSKEIIRKLHKRSDLFFKRRKKKNIHYLLKLEKKEK